MNQEVQDKVETPQVDPASVTPPQVEPEPPADPIKLYEELEKEHGVKKDQIEQWKARFGKVAIVSVQEQPYIYRGLSRPEWAQMMSSFDNLPQGQLKREEAVALKGLLFPKMLDFLALPGQAGLPTLISTLVLQLSSFEPDLPPILL